MLIFQSQFLVNFVLLSQYRESFHNFSFKTRLFLALYIWVLSISSMVHLAQNWLDITSLNNSKQIQNMTSFEAIKMSNDISKLLLFLNVKISILDSQVNISIFLNILPSHFKATIMLF